MELLVERGADLDIRVRSLLWGESFDWETVVFDTTPISYAQCGLYKQFHRAESDIYSNIAYLHERRYGVAPAFRNVPNKYLIALVSKTDTRIATGVATGSFVSAER